jgi:hypothetical protein
MAGIASNASSSLALTGFYDCPVDFGGGPLPSNGRDSLFVTTFDSNGNFVWSRGFGAADGDVVGRSVAMNDAGQVFVAGDYSGRPDLGGGVLPASSSGMFVAAYDHAGTHLWSRGYDSAAMVRGQSLALGPAGQVFVLGAASRPVDLGAGAPEAPGTFVLMLTSSGAYAGVNRFVPEGPSSKFDGVAVAAGAGGQVAFTGSLAGAVGFGGTSLSSAGSSDVVVGLLAP